MSVAEAAEAAAAAIPPAARLRQHVNALPEIISKAVGTELTFWIMDGEYDPSSGASVVLPSSLPM
jgi:hypothetical protein